MKYLTLLLLLSCGQVVAQKKLPADTSKLFSVPGVRSGTGFADSLSEITMWDDGSLEIKGDSIHAIKLLWKRLNESNKREAKLANDLYRTQTKLIQTYKDWMKSNDENIKMVERQFDKLKEKTVKQ